MPLYEYECEACGHVFEVIQKFSDSAVDKCPKCGGPVHKRQSAPAFHLKGTGWYITDYAKKDQSSAPGKSDDSVSKKEDGSAAADGSGKKDAAKPDKPAEKTAAAETGSSSKDSKDSKST